MKLACTASAEFCFSDFLRRRRNYVLVRWISAASVVIDRFLSLGGGAFPLLSPLLSLWLPSMAVDAVVF